MAQEQALYSCIYDGWALVRVLAASCPSISAKSIHWLEDAVPTAYTIP